MQKIILIIVALFITALPVLAETDSGKKLAGNASYPADVLKNKEWVTFKTEKIRLHVYRNSEAEKDKDIILKNREEMLSQIESFFGRQAPKAIDVFLYPSYQAAKEAGVRVGTASPAYFACFAVYQPGKWDYEKHNPGHEITHIFSNTDKDNQQIYLVGLLDEGIAEYLSGFEMDPHLRLTQHWQAHGVDWDYIEIREDNLDYGSLSLYPIAGSFVKFLIENHANGQEKFLALLQQTRCNQKGERAAFNKFKNAVEKIYNIKFERLIFNWNKMLEPYWAQEYEIDNEDKKEIQTLIVNSGHGKIKKIYYESFPRFISLSVLTQEDEIVCIEPSSRGWKIKWSTERRNK